MRRQKYLRGLAELKTRYGLGASKVAPHTAYMKITSLEIEKLRLNRMRETAMLRIADIDARFREIQREKTALLAAIGPLASATSTSANGERNRGVAHQRSGTITLRY